MTEQENRMAGLRLRQAHAIITIARLLTGQCVTLPGWYVEGNGIEMSPFDQDEPGRADSGPDCVDGGLDICPPETPGYQTRMFSITLEPVPDSQEINALVTYSNLSNSPDHEQVFWQVYDVAPAPDDPSRGWRQDVCEQAAAAIVEAITRRAAAALNDLQPARPNACTR